jgi:hypothetical protein
MALCHTMRKAGIDVSQTGSSQLAVAHSSPILFGARENFVIGT